MSHTILITGASSGIGPAAALELLRAGHVYGGARRVESMAAVGAAGGHVVPLDVTIEADLERVVQTIITEQGRIDVLINNAGLGLYPPPRTCRSRKLATSSRSTCSGPRA